VLPEPIQPVPMTIVVDIANVMGARADGWWKDRARAAARLCREVGDLSRRGLAAGELPAEVAGIDSDRVYPHWVLVLEGAARRAAMPEVAVDGDLGPAVRLVLAPGSGDDAIAREAADLQGCRLVVTADRELRRRCEQAGAIVTGPRWLLDLL
jgi:8-oxo-dGTP diphosphatase